MHARRVRTETGPIDRRRLAAAGLSAVLPGLGQLFNGRRRLAAIFLVPSLILVLLGAFLFATQPTMQLAAKAAAPDALAALLTLNLILLLFRLLAVGQAFLDTRRPGPTGRTGVVGIAIILLLVVVPHVAAYRYGAAFGDTFARVFAAGGGPAGDGLAPSRSTGPDADERLNILLLGIDKIPSRTATLSDTMMVASIDPVGKTVSLVSVPRDLIGVPLGNGDNFGPKLNSLLAYADRHPKDFPDGGVQALEDAIGALLGIEIHYYARTEFFGFVDMVDAVGGVDIDVTQGFDDPTYDGFGFDQMGFDDHGRSASPRRAPCARLRAGSQGRRRERLHASCPPAAGAPGAARCRHQGRFAVVGTAATAGCRRQDHQLRPARRAPAGACRRARPDRGRVDRPSGHPTSAGAIGADPLRIVAGPRSQRDPRCRRPAVHGTRDRTDALADARTDDRAAP